MARHNEILNKFKDVLADGFSFENEVHKSMVRRSIVQYRFHFFNVRANSHSIQKEQQDHTGLN